MAGGDDIGALKARAVELRLQGFRAKEISEVLGSGHSPWTVRHWLRTAKIPSTQERVLSMARAKTTNEIADVLKVSKRQVQSILHKAGLSNRERNSTLQNVDLFLSNPQASMKARFTQSRAFGWTLLKRNAKEVERKPAQTLVSVVNPSLELLGRVWRTRRKETTRRQALCLFVQEQGIEGRVYTLLGEHDRALATLERALDQSAGCIKCEADELRRLCVLYISWKKWGKAYDALSDAHERYQSLDNSGHDLLGNGIANCLLLKSILRYFTESPEAGAEEARHALTTLHGAESPILFGNLAFALAKCLQKSKRLADIQESRVLLDWCSENLEMAKECSVPRMTLSWLRGLLASVCGAMANAIDDLTFALDDAQVLELEREISSILADLGMINPVPRDIRNYIEDFCDWDDNGTLVVPPWCSNLRDEITSVYETSLVVGGRMDQALFSRLRTAAKGETLMPAFVHHHCDCWGEPERRLQ